MIKKAPHFLKLKPNTGKSLTQRFHHRLSQSQNKTSHTTKKQATISLMKGFTLLLLA